MKFSILSLSLAVVVFISSTAGQEGSRRPVCPNKCPRCFPRFVECKFGEEKDFCGCCTICYKGEGESCGTGRGIGDGGKCADGLYCVPKFNFLFPLSPQERGCRYNHHICMAPCHKVRCIPPPTCTFGRAKDTCGCCDICLQTPGEFCGEYLKCGTGLDCIEPRPNQGACRPRYPEILYALEKLQV